IYSRSTVDRATLFREMNVTIHQRLPEELVASTTFLLKRLGFAAKERGMEAYEREDVHPYHYAILLALDEGGHETQGAIADALGYDRGQLVGLLDELEERGLIERRRDPNDRRRHLVQMTADGRRRATAAPPADARARARGRFPRAAQRRGARTAARAAAQARGEARTRLHAAQAELSRVATMADLDELALSLPQTTKRLTSD